MTVHDPECANGWILRVEYPPLYGGKIPHEVADPCPVCKPGWIHPADRKRELSEEQIRAERDAAARRGSKADEDLYDTPTRSTPGGRGLPAGDY